MNILVTGGAGFIGSNLCKRLIDEGHNVTCVDNFYTGRLTNLKELVSNKRFKHIKMDITDTRILNFFSENRSDNFDQIYNLACPASPPAYQADPIGTLRTNFIGATNVLELARMSGARVLQTSTSEVYGEPLVHPQPETYRGNVNPIGIRACYDEGKRVAETLFFEYNRLYDVDIRVVRIFNTYGPNMDPNDGRVVSNFICQALKGEDITIYGTGDQTRSFCYVDDLVDGLIRMMNGNVTGPVNLGNPGEFTVRELADMVISKIDTKSNIVFKDLPSDDPTRRRPNIELAKEELGWEPTTVLSSGIDKTIDYFRKIVK